MAIGSHVYYGLHAMRGCWVRNLPRGYIALMAGFAWFSWVARTLWLFASLPWITRVEGLRVAHDLRVAVSMWLPSRTVFLGCKLLMAAESHDWVGLQAGDGCGRMFPMGYIP